LPSQAKPSVPNAFTNALTALKYVLPFDDGGERLAVSFDLGGRYFNDVVTIRANESDDSTVYVRFQDLRWLVLKLLNLASAIEAATAGETTKIGSTEGESATAEGGDAQTTVPSTPGSNP
jgi:hypothetical protein